MKYVHLRTLEIVEADSAESAKKLLGISQGRATAYLVQEKYAKEELEVIEGKNGN